MLNSLTSPNTMINDGFPSVTSQDHICLPHPRVTADSGPLPTDNTMASSTAPATGSAVPSTFEHPSRPSLPANFAHSNPPPRLVTQGAEALLYRTHFLLPHVPCALKYRPRKPYRHPILDARLTRHRILAEARLLLKCRREGVNVPGILAVDWETGWLMMEWVEGRTVRRCLDEFLGAEGNGVERVNEEGARQDDEARGHETQKELMGLMGRVGNAVGKMHEVGVVHGDLTTSNLMLRTHTLGLPSDYVDGYTMSVGGREGNYGQRLGPDDVNALKNLEGDVTLIDFGLAAFSFADEDRAVDLYVLERAFISTHPRAEVLFQEVLRVYSGSYKGAKVALKRLEEVRQRGRKKTMIG